MLLIMKEILTMLNASDLKQKVSYPIMCSAGLRVGALPTLLVKHLTKMGDVYKIDVYKGLKGKDQYYTFCSPECVTAIDTYLQFRERCGEKITRFTITKKRISILTFMKVLEIKSIL